MDYLGLAAVITSLGVLATSFATAVVMVRTGRVEKKVDAIHVEVKTINDQSIAQLADADETRRIEAKDGSLTIGEAHHMDSVHRAEKGG